MKRLLVNDALNQLGEVTFWTLLRDWFGMDFVGGDYATLADAADGRAEQATLIIRNATYFPPLKASARVPTISLLQDIIRPLAGEKNDAHTMQHRVIESSDRVVFNSAFTQEQYKPICANGVIIPLPVDFSVFEPGNSMGLQQALSLPDGAVCWIGASLNSAGHIKGYDVFLNIVRANPDIPFVGVFKDVAPEYGPPNLRCYTRLTHDELVRVIGACRVGLCTSRTESQHLAGIEMGACGLPMVAPSVGVYWKRADLPVTLVDKPESFASAIRSALANHLDPDAVRAAWRKGFDVSVIRAAWQELIKEVECSGAS